MSLVSVVVIAVWAMLPAYVPNNVAVVAGGGRPIDGGRTWREARLLGDGKTWRGTVVGTAAGVSLAFGLNYLTPVATEALGIGVPKFTLRVAVTLALGAMLGDIGASLLKRRLDRERGAPVPGLDQLDFALGALVLTAVVAPEWFSRTFTIPVLLAVLVATPLLHVGTNAIAYALSLKDEPY